MDKSKTKHELTLAKKVQLIKDSSVGKSQRQLAADYGIGKSQVQRILKRKAEFMTAYDDNNPGSCKRPRVFRGNDTIDEGVWDWFKKCRSMNIPVSDPMIQEKALTIARAINNDDFKASNGWLEKFKT